MKEYKFPKMNVSKQKGLVGQVHFEKYIIEKHGWLFHKIEQENDFGIDGYIEIVENENVTGKLIGIQIKYGNSYFKKRNNSFITFYGEDKHLNYYMNSSVPIIIVLISDDLQSMYWVKFEIEKTIETKNGWSIQIPTQNQVNIDSKYEWLNIGGIAADYSQEIDNLRMLDSLIAKAQLGVIVIPKENIVDKDFKIIKAHINRIAKNQSVLSKKYSTIEIIFFGYDDDPRELYEIDEVNIWLRESLNEGIPWFYFMSLDRKAGLNKLLLYAYCTPINIIRNGTQNIVYFNKEMFSGYLEINFANLNKFMEDNGLSLSLNKKVSNLVTNFYFNAFKETKNLTTAST